ncbi:MAG: hypothetical protein DSY50_00610 [Desulfobulbus sp.]|nr:MAG: hypothetical protein DSY50_00610 [Desulfobulbus sp.]
MAAKQRLGDLLINAGLLTEDALRRALQVQVGGNRRLGSILVKMNFITADQLHSVLSEQLGLPIISIKKQFLPEAKGIIPQYLCKKYSVIPLSLDENNLLNLAMVDPSDNTAISDIEHYTGRVVRPFLSAKRDIDDSIKKYIPWTIKDIFNPQNSLRITAIIATIALTMIVITGIQSYNDRVTAKRGTVTRNNEGITYANHELFITFLKDKQISLRGHGAYTTGYYSITFPDKKALEDFINQQKKSLSIQQTTWIFSTLSRYQEK